MVDKGRTIQQRTPPWWSRSPVEPHGFDVLSRPTPAASAEGVDQGRCGGVKLNSINWPSKKLFTKLNDFILVFYLPLNFAPSKNDGIALPHASHLSRLPSIVHSVAAACFWLVVVCFFVDQRPSKATTYFN